MKPKSVTDDVMDVYVCDSWLPFAKKYRQWHYLAGYQISVDDLIMHIEVLQEMGIDPETATAYIEQETLRMLALMESGELETIYHDVLKWQNQH